MADEAHDGVPPEADAQDDTQPGDKFIYLSLAGARFDALGMPADATVELKAVRDALFEMARQAWLDQHPGRARVPAGFGASFDLRLISIGEGSARPVLRLRTPGVDPRNDTEDVLPAIQAGRTQMLQTLEVVRDDRALPANLRTPERVASVLAKIGRSLGENESVAIGLPEHEPLQPGQQHPHAIEIDAQTRQTLQAIDRALSDNAEAQPFEAEGIVTEFDSHIQSFHLRTEDGFVLCHIASGDFSIPRRVKEVIAADGVTAPDVVVRGWATPDRRGRVRSIQEVYDVTPVRSVEGKALVARLKLVEALQDGWSGPDSLAVAQGIVEAVRPLIDRLGALPTVPAAGPRPDGSFAFEAEVAGRYLTAVVEEDGDRMFLCSDDPKLDRPDEIEAPFDADRLVAFMGNGEIR